MKRRTFIGGGLVALGGIVGGALIGQNILLTKALEETGRTYDDIKNNTYDLIINGAGLSGFFVALEASKKGLKVLVLDKRTSPGFDLAAKRKLWISTKGVEKWDEELLDLFCPETEKEEISTTSLLGIRNSCDGDELIFFAGSIKKGMLRSLLVNNVDVLLMTDVSGIVTDAGNNMSGALLACKHGLFTVKGTHFLDATDNNIFTRKLFNQDYQISDAGFVMEVDGVENLRKRKMLLDDSFGLLDNMITVHQGKKFNDQYLLEFRFPVKDNDVSKIEQKARFIATNLSKNFPKIDASLENAKLQYHALECSFNISGNIPQKFEINGFNYVDNSSLPEDGNSVLQIRDKAKSIVQKLSLNKAQKTGNTLYYIGGKTTFNEAKESINEDGYPLPLYPFTADELNLDRHKSSVLVAGGGTAGAMAAWALSERKVETTLVEYYNDLGGTKSVGGVERYYHGFQAHKHIAKLEMDVKNLTDEYNLRTTVRRGFYYLKNLSDFSGNVIHGAIICGAEKQNNVLKSVLISVDGKLLRIESKLTIDATGDGDVAFFAGESYEVGDKRTHITQNYSQWDIPFRPKTVKHHRDYDLIDNTKISEFQRGLYLTHYESHYYDFYPMLTVRESRRPEALHRLNIKDILTKNYFDDTLLQARSDYDPHYFGNSEFTRCAFMLPHYDNKELVNIPYRCIVPKKTDGLLLSGKAIGQTHIALQYTRMSADITVLGYVTGWAAAEILKQKVQPRHFDYQTFKKELIHQSYLPAEIKKNTGILQQIVPELEAGNQAFLFKACLMDKKAILPLLSKSYKNKETLLVAKAMLWFGESKGIKLVIDDLKKMYEEEIIAGHPSHYYEKYDESNLYWKINQDIALLAMGNNNKANQIIADILENTSSGGPRVPGPDAYNAGRIDIHLIPTYNRIVNLCFYVERNPDTQFILGLEKLLSDEFIKGYKTTLYNETRWRVYSANLELFIGVALARCGAKRGVSLLIDYLDDIHANFRYFACNELAAITGESLSYERKEWKKLIKRFSPSVTPLRKEIEV